MNVISSEFRAVTETVCMSFDTVDNIESDVDRFQIGSQIDLIGNLIQTGKNCTISLRAPRCNRVAYELC